MPNAPFDNIETRYLREYFSTLQLGTSNSVVAQDLTITAGLVNSDMLQAFVEGLVQQFIQPAIDKNLGTISPMLYGAVGDGIALDDDAIASAVAAAFAQQSLIITNGGVNTQRAIVVGANREYRVSRPIVIPTGGSVIFTGLRFIVDDSFAPVGGEPSYVFATGEGPVLNPDDLHNIKSADIDITDCWIDCRHVAGVGGIYVTNAWGFNIDKNRILHCSGRAIDVDGETRNVTSHEWRIYGNYIREWVESEPPDPILGDGFHNAALRVGTGIRINAPDGIIALNDVGFCKFPLDIDFGGNRYMANHWYGGSIDITHPKNDELTRFGASATSFTADMFDNHTSLTVHNPSDMSFSDTCLFYSPLVGGTSTTDRWFVTVRLDSTAEVLFQQYQISLDGIFWAPSVPLGRVKALRVIVDGTGPQGHVLLGKADGQFRIVPPERWNGVYSATVSRRDFDVRQAGESLELRLRDFDSTKWAIVKTTTNDLLFRNEVLGGTPPIALRTADSSVEVYRSVLTGLSTFADNAAAVAGGLAVGRVYRTVTGELRIVI